MKIPSDWQDQLQRVQQLFPSAVIAGGALRDLFYGKEPKDVDVFIEVQEAGIDLSRLEMLRTIFPDVDMHPASEYGAVGHEMGRLVKEVYTASHLGWNYDLIFITHDYEYLIDSFDMSIAQIVYDGVKITTSDAFDETERTKVVTIENEQSTDRIRKRCKRLLSKYPDFTVDHWTQQELPF